MSMSAKRHSAPIADPPMTDLSRRAMLAGAGAAAIAAAVPADATTIIGDATMPDTIMYDSAKIAERSIQARRPHSAGGDDRLFAILAECLAADAAVKAAEHAPDSVKGDDPDAWFDIFCDRLWEAEHELVKTPALTIDGFLAKANYILQKMLECEDVASTTLAAQLSAEVARNGEGCGLVTDIYALAIAEDLRRLRPAAA